MGPSPLSLYPPHPATADGSWRHRGARRHPARRELGQWDGRGVAFLSPSSPPPEELSQAELLKFHVSFVYQQANNRETLVPLKYNADRLPLKEAPAAPWLRKQLTWPLQLSLCPHTGAAAWATGHRDGCLAWPTSPVNRRGWGGCCTAPVTPPPPASPDCTRDSLTKVPATEQPFRSKAELVMLIASIC